MAEPPADGAEVNMGVAGRKSMKLTPASLFVTARHPLGFRWRFPLLGHRVFRLDALRLTFRDGGDQAVRHGLIERKLQIALRPLIAAHARLKLGIAHRRIDSDVRLERADVNDIA